MPMDGLTVGFAARELDRLLNGGRVDKITQPERDSVVLVIRADGENRRLLLCASPNNARCHLTNETYSNPLEPPALCMLMRKQISGARVTSVRQVDGDRIVHIDFDAVNEMGDHVLRRLVLEIMGRHSNLILLDENGRILEAARHVSPDMSRVRQVQPGMSYLPPPAQGKLNPETLTADDLFSCLQSMEPGCFSRAVADCITGISRPAAEELAFRVLAPGGDWPENLQDACIRLADLLHRLPGMADPRILTDETGAPADVFAFPYLSRDLSFQKPYPTLSAALDSCYRSRDARDRLAQRSASMLRMLKGQVERCEKKLAMQEEELASAERMDEYRRMGEAINANLYRLKKGMPEAVLPDWSDPDGGQITVPLDPKLTPGQNAQKYFKKYQKARSARETAAIQRDKTLEELDYLEGMLLDLDKCSGESDMPGSHVVIRASGEIPQETMKQAALLAAWFSKGQHSSLVPVDYTRKRYVKKPSGAAPGKVIYTHQRTAYITPDDEEIRKITGNM